MNSQLIIVSPAKQKLDDICIAFQAPGGVNFCRVSALRSF